MHPHSCFHFIGFIFLLLLHRVNIEIFGSLLKNAVVRKDCFFIMDLLNRAISMNLKLDDRAIKVLDKFKRETTEAIAKYVSIWLYIRIAYFEIPNINVNRIEEWKCHASTERRRSEKISRSTACPTDRNWRSLKYLWNLIRGSNIDIRWPKKKSPNPFRSMRKMYIKINRHSFLINERELCIFFPKYGCFEKMIYIIWHSFVFVTHVCWT